MKLLTLFIAQWWSEKGSWLFDMNRWMANISLLKDRLFFIFFLLEGSKDRGSISHLIN